jgi:hypothetical protein
MIRGVLEMKKLVKMFVYLFAISNIVIFEAQASVEAHWAQKLALTLLIDKGDIQSGSLHLRVTLSNKTNKKLLFSIPTSFKALTIYPLSRLERKSLLSRLLAHRMGQEYLGKEIEIQAKGEIVFKSDFDLSLYQSEHITNKFVELQVKFDLFRYNDNRSYFSTIESNKVKYTIAKID